MLRTVVAIILSLSIALPGIVMASPEQHAHHTVSHTGHGHHQHDYEPSCGLEDCEVEIAVMCCAMMAGHCSSIGVPMDRNNAGRAALCGLAELWPSGTQLRDGQSFEADPPPPRI